MKNYYIGVPLNGAKQKVLKSYEINNTMDLIPVGTRIDLLKL